jgi:hypothetical protein
MTPMNYLRVGVLGLLLPLGCGSAAFFNNTTSLGGDVPGGRGNIFVGFINKTPFRAIFTFGSYDPRNPLFPPQFKQFFVDPDPENRLEGNSESAISQFQCGRAISVGGTEFIEAVRDSELEEAPDEAALQPGIAFSDKPLDDPAADEPTAGRAAGVTTLQGAEFECESLLIYTFEVDPSQPGGFRIDLDVILQ